MTSPSFSEQIRAGGTTYAAVWHPAGLPWACTTDPDLVAALADTTDADVKTFRAKLFGEAQIAGGGMTTTKAAYDVQIVPTLSLDLGTIKYQYHDTKGISGGDYTVSIARDPSGLTYTYRTSGSTKPGRYAGLDIVEDYRYDPSLLHARLAENYNGTGSSLTYSGPTGAALHTQINVNTAADVVTYLWVGAGCVMARDSVDNGDGTYTITVFPGAFRAPTAASVVRDDDGHGTAIVEAPMSGIVGRPAHLWLVTMRDGEIQDIATAEPFLWGTGSVANGPRGDASAWKIHVKSWLSWLDADVPTIPFPDGTLRGYRFCVQQDHTGTGYANVQMPHILIDEKVGAGDGVHSYFSVWLFDVNDTEMSYGDMIEFDDLDTLAERAIKAIQSEATTFSYSGTPGDLSVANTSEANEEYARITGPAAWVLGWGSIDSAEIDTVTLKLNRGQGDWQFRSGYSAHNAYRLIKGSYYAGDIDYDDYIGPAAYYYQYNWTNDEAFMSGWDPTLTGIDPEGWYIGGGKRAPLYSLGSHGVPYTKAVGDDLTSPDPDTYILRVKDSIDATAFTDGAYAQLGSGKAWKDNVTTGPAGRVLVDTTGDNYILPDYSGTLDKWNGSPVIRWVPDMEDTIGNDVASSFRWGMDVAWWPDARKDDPWRVHLANDWADTSLSDFFKSLLGASTALPLPLQSLITWVPDVGRSTTLGFKTLIDWDTLEDMATEAYDPIRFKMPEAGNLNLAKMLTAVCQHLGIRQVIEWSSTQSAWWMTFAQLGVVSPAAALLAGRHITEEVIEEVQPVEIHGSTWLASSLKLTTDYKGKDPLLEVDITNRTGLAEAVGGDETFKVEDKATQLKPGQYDDAVSKMYDLIHHLAVPEPTVDLSVTPAAWPRLGCGVDIQLTSSVVREPYTGEIGISDYPGVITALSLRCSESRAGADLTVRLSPYASMVISPSMIIEDGWQTLTGTLLAVSGADTDPGDNHFAKDSSGLTDLATFGCFHYDPAEGAIAANECSCTRGFRVTLFKQHDAVHYSSGAGAQSVWTGTVISAAGTVATDRMTLANVNAGEFQVLLDDATNFPTAPYADLIMIFADRDAANIQACQLVYGWHADPDDASLDDSDGDPARLMYLT